MSLYRLFSSARPSLFDAVVLNADDTVARIEVKQATPSTNWIWGAVRMSGTVFHALRALWLRPERGDEYLGSLVNAWIAEGGVARGVQAGQAYVDVGTLDGYRSAIRMLEADSQLAGQVSLGPEETA